MSKSVDVALKVAEREIEKEMNSKINARMKASLQDIGHVDGLRATILSFVASENYQRAMDELQRYVDSKYEYPKFAGRVERYVEYCGDLINAIKAKRSFPGMQYLSSTKQQELYDKAMGHFEELKATLRRIELVERELRLNDLHSTVYVVWAVVIAIIGIFVVGFLKEVAHGTLPAAVVLIDDFFSKLVNEIFARV
jgi:hypothetical protein